MPASLRYTSPAASPLKSSTSLPRRLRHLVDHWSMEAALDDEKGLWKRDNGMNSVRKFNQHKRIICLTLVLFGLLGGANCQIEQLKDCGPNFLCRKNGTHTTHAKHQIIRNTNHAFCYCDNCAQFGDCCVDKATYPTEKTKSHCVQLSLNQSVNAVSTCDATGPLKLSCEKNIASKEYHYMIDIPVYSNQTGLYYANIYCAHCHSQLNAVGHPTLSVKCTPNITIEMLVQFGEYQRGELRWKVGEGTCVLSTEGIVENARFCTRAISDCPPRTDPSVSAKCRAYSMLTSSSQRAYRNPHCALCNGVSQSDLTCDLGRGHRPSDDFSTVSEYTWEFERCQVLGSVWDELHRKCEPLNCAGDLNCLNVNCNYSDPNDMACQIINQLLTKKIDRSIMHICLSLSILCLFLHMVVSFCFQQSNNVPAKLIDTLAMCLFVSQICCFLAINPLYVFTNQMCFCLAISIQFFCLASFLWMHAISIDVCCTFSNSSLDYTPVRKYSIYAAYAWGLAVFITAISIVADFTDFIPIMYRPHYGARPTICWFGSRNGVVAFFYFPISLIIFLNTTLFTITVYWFQKQRRDSETLKRSRKKEYSRLWLYIKLSVIMGAAWMFGLIKFITNSMIYGYLFTAFTALQGVFLFVMFDLKSENIFVLGFRRRQKRRSTVSYDQVSSSISRRKSRGSFQNS